MKASYIPKRLALISRLSPSIYKILSNVPHILHINGFHIMLIMLASLLGGMGGVVVRQGGHKVFRCPGIVDRS